MEHLLYEHSKGYLIFEVKKIESIAPKSYNEYLKLTQVVKLVSSYNFQDSNNALENIQRLCENNLPHELKNLLELNEIKTLYCDPSLKQALVPLKIKWKYNALIMRGIRQNLHRLIKDDEDLKFILCISHKFSRNKVEYNIKKEDKLIIHTLNMLEQLEKDINGYTMRVKELYGWSFPELYDKCVDNKEFIDAVKYFLDENSEFDKEKRKMFKEIKKNTIGISLKETDLENINNLCDIIKEKMAIKDQLAKYLQEKMDFLAPNLCEFLGDHMAAKIVVLSGGMMNLAKNASSTIQLLGAEKKLFQALKSKTNTPKYGILYNSKFVTKTIFKNRAKLCRFISAKISILAKIDAFSPIRTRSYGKAIRKLVEKKIISFDSGNKVEDTDVIISKVYKKLIK